jgi:DNA polymerase-4
LDCDAFFAAVEKRDNPEIRGKPVIVGGGDRRGVVAAACYVARINGVRSAMPIFQARKLCPNAVIIAPDMAKYSHAGRQIRSLMETLTPLVEPLSIDEAFLDLSGTQNLHGMSPAQSMAKLVLRIEQEVGVNASVGLSYNKFLAKIASDLRKPRGFAIIGKAEAEGFLAQRPVSMIWGVGASLHRKLNKTGIHNIGDLQPFSQSELIARYGSMGKRLYNFCRAHDIRSVTPSGPAKSLSADTTFDHDMTEQTKLSDALWKLTDKVSTRLKESKLGAGGVTLKLKTSTFRTITRSLKLADPTQMAEELFSSVMALLQKALTEQPPPIAFRLIGMAATRLVDAAQADKPNLSDLANPARMKRVKVETAMDQLRQKFGQNTIKKGRGL